MKYLLYGIWVFFYFVCGILGLMEPKTSLQALAMTGVSLLFFLPPALLLADAIKRKNEKTLKRLRFLSILSLGLTLIGFIVNIGAIHASEQTGLALYRILNFLSVPMICSRHYVLSLFLWAALLFSTFSKLYKKTEK